MSLMSHKQTREDGRLRDENKKIYNKKETKRGNRSRARKRQSKEEGKRARKRHKVT